MTAWHDLLRVARSVRLRDPLDYATRSAARPAPRPGRSVADRASRGPTPDQSLPAVDRSVSLDPIAGAQRRTRTVRTRTALQSLQFVFPGGPELLLRAPVLLVVPSAPASRAYTDAERRGDHAAPRALAVGGLTHLALPGDRLAVAPV